jgi:serine/threonine-protein kinase Chk2
LYTKDAESEEEDEEEDSETWGFLFPLQTSLLIQPLTYRLLDPKKNKKTLNEEEEEKLSPRQPKEGKIKVGRASENDIIITDDQLPQQVISNISRLQFIIERNKDGTVQIEDRSSNGTFLDEKKIGKGKKQILTNNNEITMAETPAYMFMSTKKSLSTGVPK